MELLHPPLFLPPYTLGLTHEGSLLVLGMSCQELFCVVYILSSNLHIKLFVCVCIVCDVCMCSCGCEHMYMM